MPTSLATPPRGESRGMPASRSKARQARPASVEKDEHTGSLPSRPSHIEGNSDIGDEGRAYTEPVVPTLLVCRTLTCQNASRGS